MAVTEEILRRPPAREPAARTYPQALPVVPVRARGLTVEGADGRRYLDCLSGAGTLALGHNHPVVLDAIRKVLDSGAPLNVPDLTTPVEETFVTELLRTLPPGLRDRARVRFCGPAATDAVTAARALVRAATGRTAILGFTGSGHSVSADAVKASDSTQFTGLTAPSGSPLPYPQDFPCPFGVARPYGAELAARWDQATLDDGGTDAQSSVPITVTEPGQPPSPEPSADAGIPTPPAGVILEPVQDEGGVIPAPDAWVRRMRQITAARSIPLIVDESQTGVGRTGAFWAVEHSGVTPDVMILSRAIGGSLPLAVVVHRDDLLGAGEPTSPTGPYRGNQLAMAAGAATLAHVRRHRLAERSATLGSRLLRQLRSLADDFTCVGEVRGRGLMIGVELVDPEAHSDQIPDGAGHGYTTRPPHPPAPRLATAVQRECLRRGLIVGVGGGHPSVVRLLPPLTITDEQADAVLDRLADALTAVARHHHSGHLTDPAQ
ncbi:aminotransferase class III-fold pyridoxal phosphate-dependent enzyme [Streptomyces sp. NPDC052687]|uniref:aminotransferase class III-fold pyridoxal phosphate-dependent enzyme n=1 Tax=Streptomyces sp. NPDC052687 TaxID=3154759 RepID=UPI003435BD37